MLAEIYCKEFINEGKERGIIKFKYGLNVVVGTEKADNSIGKSTFLMAVDYCFGGSDYAKANSDVLRNVGEHAICFTHAFRNEEYRFSRSASDPTTVWICDADYKPQEEISRDEFNKMLAWLYGVDGLGGSFRELIGCFMRVYGRSSRDVKRPLRAYEGSSMENELSNLIKWYGKYTSIEEKKNLAKQADAEKKDYLTALKRNFVVAAATKADVAINESKIAELESNLKEIVAQSKDNLADIDAIIAARIAELKRELSAVRRHRTKLVSRLNEMEDDLMSSKFRASKDIKRLSEYFPAVNIKKIEDIEQFHSDLACVLTKEHKKACKATQMQIALLDERIANLEKEIRSIAPKTNVTVAVLDSYADTVQEIGRLRDANDAYAKKKTLTDRASELSKRSKVFCEEILKTIQQEIDSELIDLNAYVCGENRTAPHLEIKSSSSYSFSVENDSGAGAEARGMFLFDACMAKLTPLPVFIHDSNEIKQVEDKTMVKLFELYDSLNAQVFIATDKAETYTPQGTPKVLKQSTILKLDVGHELFGRSWNKNTIKEQSIYTD